MRSADAWKVTPVGLAVFLGDGTDAFGAVRGRGNDFLWVNVENAGDFRVPLAAVEKVVSGKIIVRWDGLPGELQDAIRHTLDQEDFPPPEWDPDAEAVSDLEDEAHVLGHTQADSPPDELPGRDIGSRFGAPPSVAARRRR